MHAWLRSLKQNIREAFVKCRELGFMLFKRHSGWNGKETQGIHPPAADQTDSSAAGRPSPELGFSNRVLSSKVLKCDSVTRQLLDAVLYTSVAMFKLF